MTSRTNNQLSRNETIPALKCLPTPSMKDGWLKNTHLYNSMFAIHQALSKHEYKSFFYNQSRSCDKFQLKKKKQWDWSYQHFSRLSKVCKVVENPNKDWGVLVGPPHVVGCTVEKTWGSRVDWLLEKEKHIPSWTFPSCQGLILLESYISLQFLFKYS